jgi:hypothetical protein
MLLSDGIGAGEAHIAKPLGLAAQLDAVLGALCAEHKTTYSVEPLSTKQHAY